MPQLLTQFGFPASLAVGLVLIETYVQIVWIGLAIAIASIPAGIFAVKIGNSQAMLCGICAIIPSLLK
ncbi:MAG: hypothetical protein V7K77_21410 [Nostoc sp.]|uniref:hypothetical protein n=1 Tax=Nostoc sp. TaxID=1180 RepID=UPI002FF61659